MRGESHSAMSVAIFLPTFVFLLKMNASLELLSAVVLGIMLGSLLPDLDASDSKVMYGWWRPIGLMSKYAFYKPMRRLLGERSEHREILHSLIGCVFTSLFFALISLALYLAGVFFIWYIWIGIPIGFLLHLAEDSFTKSGVRWFFPRGKRIRSTTSTYRGSEYFLVTISIVVFGSMASIVYWLIPAALITLLLVVGGTIALLVVLHRINPRISVMGDRHYSLEELVEFNIEDVGGKKIKPREPRGSLLEIDNREKQYIARIRDVGGKHVFDRQWLVSPVDCSTLEDGDIIETQTFENQKKKRIYYVVQDGIFHAFLKRSL